MKNSVLILSVKKVLNTIIPAVFVLLLFSPAANAGNETLSPALTYNYCSYVIDGDTIIVVIDGKKEKVRLIGVDTPEIKSPYTKEEPFGGEASAFTGKMTEKKMVRLEYGRQRRDRYGRLLAYVYLEDGTFLNAELVKQGYAEVYRKYPFKYRDDFIRYEDGAKENKRGMWSK